MKSNVIESRTGILRMHLETEMIVLTRSDVFAARRNAQCRDIVRVSAEESLLAGFDVPYGNLVAHRIEKMLLIRMQSQTVLRYADPMCNERS